MVGFTVIIPLVNVNVVVPFDNVNLVLIVDEPPVILIIFPFDVNVFISIDPEFVIEIAEFESTFNVVNINFPPLILMG